MLKDILISMIIWVVVGCGNGSGVKRLDTRAVEKDTVLKWSQLVGESRLVRMETKEEALLNDYFRVYKVYFGCLGGFSVHCAVTDVECFVFLAMQSA